VIFGRTLPPSAESNSHFFVLPQAHSPQKQKKGHLAKEEEKNLEKVNDQTTPLEKKNHQSRTLRVENSLRTTKQ